MNGLTFCDARKVSLFEKAHVEARLKLAKALKEVLGEKSAAR